MEKNHKNKGGSTRVVRFIAIIIISILGYQGIKLAKISKTLDEQIYEAEKQIEVESKKLEELTLEYENIESLETVEKIAREKLGLVKDDEIIFREKK